MGVVLNAIGMPMDLAILRGIPGSRLWPGITSMAIAVVLFGVLLLRRRRPTLPLCDAAFLVNVAAILLALWFSNDVYANSGRPWVPFQANKLGMVTVALLAPEMWVGVLSVGAYAGMALIQMLTFSEAVRGRFALGEPWATIAIGVFSAVLVGYRVRRLALEREVAHFRAESLTTQRFARVFLAARDLANTPLQTITFAAATAREKHPDLEDVVSLIDRSLVKLRELDQLMRDQEAAVSWTSNEESFDPRKVFDKESQDPGDDPMTGVAPR
jgi:hypothetical protein